MRRLKVPPWLVGAALYAALALLMTYPLAWHLKDSIVGWRGDNQLFVWDLWWAKQATLVRHTNPYWTDMLFYPNQFHLGLSSFGAALGWASLPLQVIWPVELVYNLLILAGVVANAMSACFLAHEVTRDRRAAFLAGAVYAFSPVFVVRITGHLSYLHAWVLPLALAFLMRWLEGGRVRHAVLTGLTVAASYMIFEQFTVFIAFAWGILLLHVWRCGVIPGTAIVRRTALALLLSLLFLSPDLYLRRGAFAIAFQDPSLFRSFARPFSVDLLGFVTPGWFHPLFGGLVTKLTGGRGLWLDADGTRFEGVAYLGFTVIALSLVALFRVKRSQTRLWLGLAGVFALMSLGPVLHVAGKFAWDPQPLGLGGLQRALTPVYDGLGIENRQLGIPLPYLLFSKIPILSRMRTPNRWVFVTVLSVAILAAQGSAALAQWLRGRAGGRRRWLEAALYPGLLGLVLFEYLAIPFPLTPVGLPAAYAPIIADRSNYAILELPVSGSASVDDMYFQTLHGRPLLHALVAVGYEQSLSFINSDPFLAALARPESIVDAAQAFSLARLRQYRVKYVVVNEAQLADHTRLYGGSPEVVLQLLESNLSELPSDDAGFRVFLVFSDPAE